MSFFNKKIHKLFFVLNFIISYYIRLLQISTMMFPNQTKNCQLCGAKDAPHADESTMCQICEKHTTPAQKQEFERVTDEHRWCNGTHIKRDHLKRIFQNKPSMETNVPSLALFRIFLMLTQIATTAETFLPTCLNYLQAMASVVEPWSFINHLRIHAPKHHKMWHDFLLYVKYDPYISQTIPDCLGPVCFVSPANNPQIAKKYHANGLFHQETTIGVCACNYKTKCETEEECFDYSLHADGNCNVFEIDAKHHSHDIDNYFFDFHKSSDVVTFAMDFFNKLEASYCKKFMSELRYNVWLQSALDSDAEPVTEYIKEDTRRVVHKTDKMRHKKTKQKNSRCSRLEKSATKRGNSGKSKRDVCVC
jgi:hypothetical protein